MSSKFEFISYKNYPVVNLDRCNGIDYKENTNFEIVFSCVGKDIYWIFDNWDEGWKMYNYLIENYTNRLG